MIFKVLLSYQEQKLQPVDDRIDGEHGFPVFSQDVQTHVSLEINVWVVHLRLTFYLWRLVRVVGVDLKQPQQKQINQSIVSHHFRMAAIELNHLP